MLEKEGSVFLKDEGGVVREEVERGTVFLVVEEKEVGVFLVVRGLRGDLAAGVASPLDLEGEVESPRDFLFLSPTSFRRSSTRPAFLSFWSMRANLSSPSSTNPVSP